MFNEALTVDSVSDSAWSGQPAGYWVTFCFLLQVQWRSRRHCSGENHRGKVAVYRVKQAGGSGMGPPFCERLSENSAPEMLPYAVLTGSTEEVEGGNKF